MTSIETILGHSCGHLEESRAVFGPSWSLLGASWECLGSLLGGLGGLLGGSQEPFEEVLGPGALGTSWQPLGPSWADKGGQHGSKLVSKTEAKSFKKRSKGGSIFGCLLESSSNRFVVSVLSIFG